MLRRDLFKKPKNTLEEQAQSNAKKPVIPDELCVKCPSCMSVLFQNDLMANQKVCPKCGHYFRMSARERLYSVCDEGTFHERFMEITSHNPLGFPEYDKKLEQARAKSSEPEGAVCGTACIEGIFCAVFAMESEFMLGSMGTALGHKVTLLFELATRERLPVIGFTVSGGARMQEGILSLMQMAKTSGAVQRHGAAGNLYICVLTDPTTGGVTASFAMQGDIILSEPHALIGFAGPRVIEQTIRQKLPERFQRAEFLLEKGFIDAIVERKDMRRTLGYLLCLHRREAE